MTKEDRLFKAIRRKFTKEELKDVAKGGADAGWHDFTYYSDTYKFYRTYHDEILAELNEMAEDIGEGVMELVKSFRDCKDYSIDEIGKALFAPKSWKNAGDPDIVIANSCAWFALEQVARFVEDE